MRPMLAGARALSLCLMLGAAGWAADGPARKATAKPTAVAKPAATPAAAVPAGAEKVDEYTWRHVDADGKGWRYRQTPFGIMKSAEDAPVPKPLPDATAKVTAVADGDSVRFERPGPFGPYRWTRKKSELTEVEKEIWDRQATAAPQNQ